MRPIQPEPTSPSPPEAEAHPETTAEATAETAGETGATLSASQLDLVRRACVLLDESDERLTLEELGRQLGASPWHLQRLFKRATGVSPRDYADSRRLHRFRSELRNGESVASATYGAGYGSSSRVYEASYQHLGMTPASYAKGGEGVRIVYGLVTAPLGRLLVAATAQGICFVSLGEDEASLEAALQDEFPRAAELRRDDRATAPALEAVVDYLEGRTPHVGLPLDVRGTAFQRQVWNALLAIPYGETRSYSEIASGLGLPKAQRAVGRACAENPVALLIPCHRVLRGDGKLGGYRWGLARKAALLKQESEAARAAAESLAISGRDTQTPARPADRKVG